MATDKKTLIRELIETGKSKGSLLFTRAVLELALSSWKTRFLVGNEVTSLEEDAPFIGVDPDKRQRSLGIVDVVVDGTLVHPEVKAGFLDHYQWNMLLLGCHAQREQEGV
jgi:hypothetical protein